MAAVVAEKSDLLDIKCDFERVCSIEELRSAPGSKLLRRLASGRGVALWWHGGKVHCLDAACYHHGAPLVDGDIEDLGGTACVVCPWHKYKIALEDGQCLYVGLDIATGQSQLKSKGVKQRPHAVEVRSDGGIYVMDSGAPASSSRRGSTEPCASSGSAPMSSGLAGGSSSAVAAPAASCDKLPAAASGALPSDEYAFKPFNSGQAPPGVHSSIGPGGFPVGYAYGHAMPGPGTAPLPMSGSASAAAAPVVGGSSSAALPAPAKPGSGGGWTVSFPFGWRGKGGQ